MKLAAINLGCPKNCVDLERMLGAICKNGVHLVQDAEASEVVIVNTCAFIQPAIEESLETIFEISKLKERGLKRLIVTGCLPQRFGRKIAQQLTEADVILGDHDVAAVCGKLVKLLNVHGEVSDNDYRQITPHHYAYLKIAEGCDNRCTYCTIPQIKGGYQSREPRSILEDARRIVNRRVREIIVVAQDTTRYGRDLGSDVTLTSLLRQLSALDGVQWLRLMYTHPAHFTDDLIETLAEADNICKYVDLPIQHASDKVLYAMGRRSTRSDLELLLQKLRSRIPGVAIRSTVMVGFPGETEEDLLTLLEFLEEARFDHLGVFTYSREQDTLANEMEPQISTAEKNARQAEVLDLQASLVANRNKALVGQTVDVIVDQYDQTLNRSIGRTEWDAPEVDSEVIIRRKAEPGDIARVRVVDSEDFDLIGKLEPTENI